MQIEGINAVLETLESGMTVEKLLVLRGNFDQRFNKAVSLAKQKGARVSFEDKKRLDELSLTGKHQGLIVYASDFKYAEISELLSQKEPLLLLILDEVQDPHNLGAVLRAADSAGANGVIIGKHRSVTVNETVVRASAGAAAHVPVVKVNNINDAIRELKDNFVTILSAEAGGESVYKKDLTKSVAIVIGGEGAGVSALTKKLSDGVISVPQLGKVNSLNASVAAGIMLYEAVRQRQTK
jgi:23S rRNA (guanosine2251-2'-O)-methyltransferase